MKKFLVLIACLLLAVFATGSVDAANDVYTLEKSGKTEVYYEANSKYTLQIPANMPVTLGYITHTEIGISDLRIPNDHCVNITISSTQFDNDAMLWNLTYTDGLDYLHYHIHKNESGVESPLKNMSSVFIVSSTAFDGKPDEYTAVQKLSLNLTADANPAFSGRYSDNVVFTAKIEPIASP